MEKVATLEAKINELMAAKARVNGKQVAEAVGSKNSCPLEEENVEHDLVQLVVRSRGNLRDDAFQLAYKIEKDQKQPAKRFPSRVAKTTNTRKFTANTRGTNSIAASANNKFNNGINRSQMVECKRQDVNLECLNCGLG
ncbi:hypothetical protein M9H77_23065 [Catharanthus roseus]|uniref:Uncharacterized protein n=1 Tax=Catharanthus roseus TaxID=4058 RepID=A0ACC0ATG4_CATRO|nr:hypothetical protein M9H77_23065 [Catharanthus roseus]